MRRGRRHFFENDLKVHRRDGELCEMGHACNTCTYRRDRRGIPGKVPWNAPIPLKLYFRSQCVPNGTAILSLISG